MTSYGPPRVSGICKIIVPVDDQEQARKFWTERVGFEVTTDEAYGDERWLEVRPPNGSPALVLSPRPADAPRRAVNNPDLPHSDVFFVCDNIQKTHQEMVERGVTFAKEPVQMPFGWWALFEDPDGTRYALTQAERE